MQIQQETENDVYVVAIQGKLIGRHEVEELYAHFRLLREQNIRHIVLNLQHLDWMGSLGMGAMISCLTSIRNVGGDVRLCNLNRKLRSLLEMTRLNQVFQTFESIELAVRSYENLTH